MTIDDPEHHEPHRLAKPGGKPGGIAAGTGVRWNRAMLAESRRLFLAPATAKNVNEQQQHQRLQPPQKRLKPTRAESIEPPSDNDDDFSDAEKTGVVCVHSPLVLLVARPSTDRGSTAAPKPPPTAPTVRHPAHISKSLMSTFKRRHSLSRRLSLSHEQEEEDALDVGEVPKEEQKVTPAVDDIAVVTETPTNTTASPILAELQPNASLSSPPSTAQQQHQGRHRFSAILDITNSDDDDEQNDDDTDDRDTLNFVLQDIA